MGGARGGIGLLRMLESYAPCVRRGALARSSDGVDMSNGFSIGSWMSSGVQVRANGFVSQFMRMCTQTGLEERLRVRSGEGDSTDARKLYEDMVAGMEKRVIPNARQLQELIRAASTAPEVALVVDAAGRVRREIMAETGKKEVRHSKEVTHMMMAAFLRTGETQSAVKLLWKKHPDGFTASIGCANLLLKHAKSHKDVTLMRHVLHVMAANDVHPTQTTADLVLRMCKETGETPLMFSLAADYHNRNLTFHHSLLDVLISTAANAARPPLVYEIQTWRIKQGLQHSTASAVSMAKALILERKPKEAAAMITSHCPASDAATRAKRVLYLSIMVKVWPLQILASPNVDSTEEYLRNLKDDMICMFDNLKDLGVTFQPRLDVNEHFAQGKGTDSVAQKEVKKKVQGVDRNVAECERNVCRG